MSRTQRHRARTQARESRRATTVVVEQVDGGVHTGVIVTRCAAVSMLNTLEQICCGRRLFGEYVQV
jgi:hypothetical protein